ncbi:hypothetical protein VPHK406_0102 [Vibrio phage K406]
MFKRIVEWYTKWQRNRLTKHYLAIQETKGRIVKHLIAYERLHKEEGFTEEQARMLKKPAADLLGKRLVLNLKSYWGVYDDHKVLLEASSILKEAIIEAEQELGYQFNDREETFKMLDQI